MLGLVSLVISAVIFLCSSLSIVEDTADVRWLPLGLFFLALSFILAGVGPPATWRRD